MKKLFIIVALGVLLLSSCSSMNEIIPQAINTVHSVTFDELNFNREDYIILNTVTADATVSFVRKGSKFEIQDANNEFEINFRVKKGIYTDFRFDGILRTGYLANDYATERPINITNPSEVVRGIAIYRLINMAQMEGADGIIEPTISTSVEQNGRIILFKTVVNAKLVKLKTDR